MGPAATPNRAMGVVPSYLPGPCFRQERSHCTRPHPLDAGLYPGEYTCGNGLATARRGMELQRRIRGPCLSVGGSGGLGSIDLYRLSQPRLTALLLARGAAVTRKSDGDLHR